MRIGFVGLGNMGTPMALRLIAAGHELSVWNRSEGRTKPLIHEGAIAAGTPAEAELGADAVMTMLWDDEAYEQVVFGPNGLMDALSPGGLHISCSTIGVALSERLTVEYTKRGIEFVAAPVFGSPDAAAEGRLWVVAGGSASTVNRTRPLLNAFSRGITVVGEQPKLANAVRLGGSFLMSAILCTLGEASAFASSQGLEPDTFIEAVDSALFQSAGDASHANSILPRPGQDEAAIEVGAKDLRLLREAAASSETRLSLAGQIAGAFAKRGASGRMPRAVP
jgi:3-hydroxyisobutyrate dehydrogenase-like beta-hydroxyacid dehydrogenase